MSKTERWKPGRMQLLLGAASALAALNWLAPAPASTVQAVMPTSNPLPEDSSTTNSSAELASSGGPASSVARAMLEAARRDPFAPPPPQAIAVNKPLPTVPPPQIAPPPAPSAPPLNLNFAGRMTGPDGKVLIYVSFGETSVAIEKGSILTNGYRVENITAEAIEFNYLPLNTTAKLAIPPSPQYETR